MPREVYIPPPRPFASPPTAQTIPTSSSLGLTGAEAWTYDVDTRVQCDPGRWELFNMIQGGMIWLDNYVLEIQRQLIQAEEDNEEVDFVDLVKTPGRNKKAPQSITQVTENAERLAKINALHFGEMERLSPVKPSTLKVKEVKSETLKSASNDQVEVHRTDTLIPASNTDQTIRPQASPRDDLHVMAHAPPTPVPLLRKKSTVDVSAATVKSATNPNTIAPLTLERPPSSSSVSRPSQAPSSSQQAPSSSQQSSQQVPSSGNEKRFGPRPLPAVPNGGMRSRTTSNASMMSTTATRIGSDRPPSRTGVQPQPERSTTLDFMAPVQQPVVQSVPSSHAIPALATKSKPAPAARTPSPIPIPVDDDDEDMDMEVEIPLNDTTVPSNSKEDAAMPVFPSILNKKHSFASLPNPSPLKKSVRGTSTHDKESNSSGATATAMAKTPNANSSGSRPSVRPSAGWLKNTTTAVARKTKGGEKPNDLAMALNSATHANFGISNSGAAAATGLKRKSEVHEESEERVAKVAKKNEGSYVSAAATITTTATPGNVPSTSAATTPGTGVSTKDRDLPNPEEDTATRLLKLRGRLNSISSSEATSVEIGEGRSRGEHSREREERSVGPSRPVSRATTDRTRVDSCVERVEEIRVSRSEETAKEKASLPHQPNSIEKKKSEIVKGEEETRSSAVKEEQPRSKTKKGDEEVGSGPGLFKFNVPMSSAKSTTPPGSPLPAPTRTTAPETGILTKKAAAAAQAAVKEAGSNATLQQQQQPPAFKPLKGSIFSALPPKADKPKGIFSRTPSQQFTPVTYFAGPQYGVESQSTEDTESQVQSVFDAPTSNKGKSSISTTVTAESQSDKVVPTKTDDNTGTTMKSGGTDQFSGWGEEGLTATWLSKGDETTGVEKKQNTRMPGAFGDEDEEEGGNWEEEDPDNVTNNRWNALKAEAMGGHQRDKDQEEEELETPVDENEDEEMMDGVDEDEVEEIVQDEVEEILEEEEEPLKPAPAASVGSGIIASIGSFTSKFGLKSLKAAAANAEKERVEKEKKEARLKEIEARRRAAAQQKKAEEEARQKELEKKRKADEERRKREKADTTLNQSFKPKKPAVPMVPSSDKKPELIKKQPSKLGLGLGSNSMTLLGASSSSKIPAAVPSSNSKIAPTPTKPSTIKLIGQNTAASTSSSVLPLPLTNPSVNLAGILGPASAKAGAKVTFQPNSSIALKNALAKNGSTTSLMSGKTVVRTEKQTISTKVERVSETGIDESAELPDIKSEYSDSEDENRPRTYDPPIWAQSPDLRQALEDMRTVNPDTIFGAMPQLRMDEIFPGRRKSKFRARTSSANWAGTDGVTAEEEIAYAKRMGFQS